MPNANIQRLLKAAENVKRLTSTSDEILADLMLDHILAIMNPSDASYALLCECIQRVRILGVLRDTNEVSEDTIANIAETLELDDDDG